MPFQFTCPQGHLLEGAESQMGQQSQCPLCGALFIMPVVNSATIPQPPSPLQHPGYSPPSFGQPFAAPGSAGQEPEIDFRPKIGPPPGAFAPPPETSSPPAFVGIEVAPRINIGPPPEIEAPAPAPPGPTPESPPDVTEPPPAPNRIVHVLCPKMHELETPLDMIGQDAICPQCRVQFRLRYEDSLEYKEERRLERERRDAEFGRKSLKFAIAAAVVVFLSIVTMIVMSRMR